MKIILIGPGLMPIPPNGWGAVESIVYDYYIHLKNKNHEPIIINDKNLNNVIQKCNNLNPDVVHIMYDDYISIANNLKCEIILYTSHFAYITHPNFKLKCKSYYLSHFMTAIKLKHKIYIFALSEEIKYIYINNGFPSDKIFVIHNGACQDKFKYIDKCTKPDKSIYLAKIETRKKQYLYQTINSIDFVGNFYNSTFNIKRNNYFGEWSKTQLYENLTNYANIILLSDGEADPLVIKEALIAGLGVIVSECASANLDKNLSFIDIIPNDKLNNLEYIENIINKNRENSINNRNEIRKYALQKFSWENIIDNYINTLISIIKI